MYQARCCHRNNRQAANLWFAVLAAITAGSGCAKAGDAAVPPDPPASVDGGTDPDAGPGTMVPEFTCKRSVAVANNNQLPPALSAARPGDCIVLADGTYTFPTITVRGTADANIVITAEHLQKALVMSGRLDLSNATYVMVRGLDWRSDGAIDLSNCTACRVSRNRLALKETAGGDDFDWVTVTGTSTDCRIDHNDLGPKIQLGNMVMLAGAGSQIVQRTRIDHNHFHDVKRTSGNGWETIRAGLSQWTFSSAHSIIESNLFERTDGDPEVISVKSSDNIVRHNTMRASAGQFTLRHGNRSEVYGNYILGDGVADAGGIRVLGGLHKIHDNFVSGVSGGIWLEGGESDDDTGNLTDHKQVYDAQVVFNTLVDTSLRIGGSHPMEPKDCTIANNIVKGSGTLINETSGTQNSHYIANLIFGGTSQISRGVTVEDPKLVAHGDVFAIASGSPAVDAADPQFTFATEDIEGRARSGAPDIGANEVTQAPAHFGLLGAADVGPLSP